MSFRDLKPVFSQIEQDILNKCKTLIEVEDSDIDVKSYFQFVPTATAKNYNQEFFSLVVEEEIDKVIDKYIPVVKTYIEDFHNKNKDISTMSDAASIQMNIKLYNEKFEEIGNIQMTRFSSDEVDKLLIDMRQHLTDANAQYLQTLEDTKWTYISTLLVKIVHPGKKTASQTNSADFKSQLSDDINKTIEQDVTTMLAQDVWFELIRYPQLQPLLLPLVKDSSAFNLFFDQVIETDPEKVKSQLGIFFENEKQEIYDRMIRLLKFFAYRSDNEDENKRLDEAEKQFIDPALGNISLKSEEDIINYLKLRDFGYWKSISEMAYFDISMSDEITCLPSNYQIYYRDYEIVESIVTVINVIFFKINKAKNNDKKLYYTLPAEIKAYNEKLFTDVKPWDFTLVSVQKLAEQFNSLVKLVSDVPPKKEVELIPVEPTAQAEPIEKVEAEPTPAEPTPVEAKPTTTTQVGEVKSEEAVPPTPTEQTSTLEEGVPVEQAEAPVESFTAADCPLTFAVEEIEFNKLPLFSTINKLLMLDSESFWITLADFGSLKPSINFLFELFEAIIVERKIPNARFNVPDSNKYLFSSVVYLCDGSKYSDYEDTEERAIANPFTYEVYTYFLNCTEYTMIFPIIQKQIPVVINTFLKSYDNQSVAILDFC